MAEKEPAKRLETESDTASLFDRYFAVVQADTPALLDAAYALRYQVYCVEHPFLDASRQQGERERDEFDGYSPHAVLIHRPSGDVVGCVRLVLPPPEDRWHMPIYSLLDDEARQRLAAYRHVTLGEISRYAVSKKFRRRSGEELYPDVDHASEQEDTRRFAPHISLGLFRAVAQLADQHHVDVVCAAMAPALLRLLGRFGFTFEPLGPPIDYHGIRQPCIAKVSSLVEGITASHASYASVVVRR